MLSIFSCFGFGQRNRPVQNNPVVLQQRSLDDIVASANDLADNIRANEQTYAALRGQCNPILTSLEFSSGIHSGDCQRLLLEIEDLENQRQAQKAERQALNREFHGWIDTNKNQPHGENEGLLAENEVPAKMQEFRRLIAIPDPLDVLDKNLPATRDYTWDCGRLDCMRPEFTEDSEDPAGKCIGRCFRFAFCCPVAAICNRSCCGLQGRAKQLSYALAKGIS